MKRAAVGMLLLFAACGGEKSAPPSPAPAAPASAAEVSPNSEAPTLVRVKIVDLEGRPLQNMGSIATAQPNAFEKPVAKGSLTNEQGVGSISISSDQHLYVRGWDPAMRMFANSYLEFLPSEASTTDLMSLTMAPGASMEATILGPDKAPVKNSNVGLMMFHPTEGPWWPDQADTDAEGRVRFPSVPPGEFTIKLKAATGCQLEIPGVKLAPGGQTDLGPIALQ